MQNLNLGKTTSIQNNTNLGEKIIQMELGDLSKTTSLPYSSKQRAYTMAISKGNFQETHRTEIDPDECSSTN